MTPTILLTGRDGQLGFELRQALAAAGRIVALGRSELDLSDLQGVRQVVRDVRPEIIVNAAAYTNVERAETERDMAHRVNAEAPAVLAEELKRQGGKLLLHYSTDYVFDGSAAQPYREEAGTNPLNVYGESKLAGERAVQQTEAPHVIVRTQWLYAGRGRNFPLSILRRAREGKSLRVVGDQVGSPTWARALAEASAEIVMRWRNAGDPDPAWYGVYHASAAGQTSWHGFAVAILCAMRERLQQSKNSAEWCEAGLRSLTAIGSADHPAAARRPAFSVLANEKIARVFGIRLPEWRQQLRQATEDFPLAP